MDDAAHMRLARMFGPIEDREIDEGEEGQAFSVPEVSNVLEDGSVADAVDRHKLDLKANM